MWSSNFLAQTWNQCVGDSWRLVASNLSLTMLLAILHGSIISHEICFDLATKGRANYAMTYLLACIIEWMCWLRTLNCPLTKALNGLLIVLCPFFFFFCFYWFTPILDPPPPQRQSRYLPLACLWTLGKTSAPRAN